MSDPVIRSGEHELWDAYMATGRTRAQLGALTELGRRMNAALRPALSALSAAMRGLADAVSHLPAGPVPEANPSRARACGDPRQETDAQSDLT